MQWMEALPALAAVLAQSVFLVLKCRIPAGFAPLAVLCADALWLAVFGMAGLLVPGAWALLVLSAALLVFALVYRRQDNDYKRLASPASLFFVLAALAAVLYLGIRRPLPYEWDEYSLWCAAVKLMKTQGELYTTAATGWPWPATQTPTLPALGYWFNFVGTFAVWKIYAAYAVLNLAVVAALLGSLSFKQYKLAVPLGFIGLLTPWFFSVYMREYEVKPIWLSSYGDLPAGMLFGGALLLYLGLRRARAPLWPVPVVLAALALVKGNTFLFALVGAGIMALDFIFFGPRPTVPVPPLAERVKRRLKRGAGPHRWVQPGRYPLAGRLGRSVLWAVAAVAPYLVWNRYIGWVVLQRLQSGQAVQPSEAPLAALWSCVRMLFGATERTEQFSTALSGMARALVGGKITMLGNPAVMMGVIAAIFLLAALLTSHRKLRRRCLLALGVSVLGFAGYYFELIVSFGRLFPAEMAATLEGYNRYLNGYFIGWFLLAVGLFAIAARDGRPYGIASGGLLALAGGMLLCSLRLLPLQYSDIGYPDAFYREQRESMRVAESVAAAVQKEGGGRVFFVSQGDDFGQAWLEYHYHLMPVLLDYSGYTAVEGGVGGGGGTFGLPGEGEGVPHYHPYTPRELQEYLGRSGCRFVFIETLDERFVDAYGELFSDSLAAAQEGRTLVYRVEGVGAALRLVPVEMEVGP